MAKDAASFEKLAPRDPTLTPGGRLRSALLVIRAQAHAVTVEDWIAMQQELASIRFEWRETLDMINRWATRQQKREERALKALASEEEQPNGEMPVAATLEADGFIPGLTLPS